jgi:hypothetical protein
VPLAPQEPAIDRRKLRGSPLREKVASISFAATIFGKMHTADLKGEDLPSDAAGWLEELRTGAATARYVADEFDKAAERLRQVAVMLPVREMLAQSETSDFPVNLPVPDVGQPVLNLATGHDQ